MTAWLQTIEPTATILREKGPELLRVPTVQKQMARVLEAANADAMPDEVDWVAVIDRWALPIGRVS